MDRDALINKIQKLHDKRMQRLALLEENDPVMQNINGQIFALSEVIQSLNNLETKEDGKKEN